MVAIALTAEGHPRPTSASSRRQRRCISWGWCSTRRTTRRGFDAVTEHVFWAGNLSTVLGVLAVGLIFARHRLAPMAAVAFGFPIAIGVAAVHGLPEWSAFSDSFVDQAMSWMSWSVVVLEIAGALATGILGLKIFRETTAAPAG